MCFFLRLGHMAGFPFKFMKMGKTIYVGTQSWAYWRTSAWHLLSRGFQREKEQQQAEIYAAEMNL